MGKCNTDFGLREPLDRKTETDRMRLPYSPKDCRENYEERFQTLNAEQRDFVLHVQQKLDNEQRSLIFLNGPAGRGKTYISNSLLNYVRGKGQIALACASSAIAAMNYPGGRTAHNMFKIPVKDDLLELSDIECDVLPTSERADLLRECRLIIWDEISMMHRHNSEASVTMLRRIRRNSSATAGIVIMCLGDFRQIPPVIQYGTANDTINASLISSPLWNKFEKFNLTVPVRQLQDLEYAHMLDDIGDGSLREDDNQEVTLDLIAFTTEIDHLIEFVYPDLKSKGYADTTHSAILTIRNMTVGDVNKSITSYLPNPLMSMLSHDSLDDDKDTDLQSLGLSEEFLNTIYKPNTPPHILELKEGMHCYFLRNLSPDDGLLNNSKIVIQNTSRQLITAKLLSTNEVVLIPRITFALDTPGMKFKINRKQFPVRCGCCKTFNRSQGDTLKRCGIDLRGPPFEHGQLYVGSSRTQTRDTILALCRPEKINDKGHPITNNIVHPELLLDKPRNPQPNARKAARYQPFRHLPVPATATARKNPPVVQSLTFRARYLAQKSLGIIHIIGDGECLYRSISFFHFDGDQSQYVAVRQAIVKELENNPEYYLHFFAANNDHEEETLNELITTVSTPGTWGSPICLTAASSAYEYDYTILFSEHKIESDKHPNFPHYVFIYDNLFTDKLFSNTGHYSATTRQ